MNSIDADAFDTDEDRFGPQEDQHKYWMEDGSGPVPVVSGPDVSPPDPTGWHLTTDTELASCESYWNAVDRHGVTRGEGGDFSHEASGLAIGTVVDFRLPGQRKTRRGTVSRVQNDGTLIVEHRITQRHGGSRRAYTRVLPSQVVTETAH